MLNVSVSLFNCYRMFHHRERKSFECDLKSQLECASIKLINCEPVIQLESKFIFPLWMCAVLAVAVSMFAVYKNGCRA